MRVETVDIDRLIEYQNNVNVHTDDQVEQIVASIREFGFCDPVGVWTNADGQLEIVEGHGRVMAAKRLGIISVPVVYLDDLTDEQRRAYSILHNQLTRNSEFDVDKLKFELDDIGDINFDFNWIDFKLDPSCLGLDDRDSDDELDDDDDFEFVDPGERDKRYITCPKCGFEWAI